MVKSSRQRRAVANILENTNTHPTAEWVYGEMKKEFPSISLATVYRNLRYMVENGTAREILTSDSSRFDANMEDHYHFICRKCGELTDIFPKIGQSELEKLSNEGYDIESYSLMIYGVCKKCGNVVKNA